MRRRFNNIDMIDDNTLLFLDGTIQDLSKYGNAIQNNGVTEVEQSGIKYLNFNKGNFLTIANNYCTTMYGKSEWSFEAEFSLTSFPTASNGDWTF